MACLGEGGEGGGVKGSRVELAKNKLILWWIYSTLLPLPLPQSKQTINVPKWEIKNQAFIPKPSHITPLLIQKTINTFGILASVACSFFLIKYVTCQTETFKLVFCFEFW